MSRAGVNQTLMGVAVAAIICATPAWAASFTAIKGEQFERWSVDLVQIFLGGQFCALQSITEPPLLRVVHYLHHDRVLLELLNPAWAEREGRQVSFRFDFQALDSDVKLYELSGTFSGDGFALHFPGEKSYTKFLVAMITASDLNVTNSDGNPVAKFSLEGTATAAPAFGRCFAQSGSLDDIGLE